MSIHHLQYVLKEIDTTSQILSIKNSTFFKRSVARLIAIRIDDFIKLGFSTNKQTENKKIIKDELNALQALYVEHFKLQRDKYGAHFQHLDFGERLQSWSEINANKADFFTEMPISIYNHFSLAAGFMPYTSTTIPPATIAIVENINDQFNLEQHPNISTDILSLTRPNSGGILNFSMIHTKAGVLKSLELLIDYEWSMIENLKGDRDILTPFIKLFIIDLLSYVDNYFTRTDITNSSPQYEEGFDYYVASNINDGTKESNEIITQFKSNFKLEEHVSELRTVRNKVGGHIDTTFTVTELDTMIDSINLVKFRDLYQRLKAIFRSICHSTGYLTQYLIDPFEKLHGVEKMVGMEVTSFEGKPFPETPSRYKSPNDEDQYEEQYKQWIATRNEDARSYFWNCFCDSEVIERIQISIPSSSGGVSYRYYDFRKAHKFFEDKLSDYNVPDFEKVAIIDLFNRCGSGYASTLAYILDKSYPNDFNLRVYYIRALGQLSQERSERTSQRCLEIFNTTNIQGKCIAMKALFGIDLTARRSSTGKHSTETSNYSILIKSILNSGSMMPFEKLSLSLALLSEYVFGLHHLSDSLDQFYKEFLINCYKESLSQLLSSSLKEKVDRQKLTEMQDIIETNRFTTLVGTLSDFMEEKDYSDQATILRKLVADDFILYAKNDNQELHNLSVIYFKIKDIEPAIKVAQFLTEKNAHQVTYNYLLLDLYRHDEKYRNDFDVLKSKVLTTFNLSDEERQDFESIQMDIELT